MKAYQFTKLNDDLTKIFIDETYSSIPIKNFSTNKKIQAS